MGGFALYFGAYSAVRQLLVPWEGASDEQLYSGNYDVTDIARRLVISSYVLFLKGPISSSLVLATSDEGAFDYPAQPYVKDLS